MVADDETEVADSQILKDKAASDESFYLSSYEKWKKDNPWPLVENGRLRTNG